MLDLTQLLPSLPLLAKETVAHGEVVRTQMAAALKQASLDGEAWKEQKQRIEKADGPWLIAYPLSDDSPSKRRPKPVAPERYIALSADGSQIPLDRNNPAPCYVLNVGEVALRYGDNERALLTSRAKLFFREEDVFRGDRDGKKNYVTERDIATRRLIMECEALTELIDTHGARKPTIAMFDGTLILWAHEAEPDEMKSMALKALADLFLKAKEYGTPVIGYLSKPGSRDVVNMLRVTLCSLEKPDKRKCTAMPHGCDALNHLTDRQLHAMLLSPGERSPVYLSRSDVLDDYALDNKIAFYYVNVGSEIARIELPLWAHDDKELLERTHALALDQAERGFGYPIALLEAHEQAVVRGPEREAFLRLLDNALIQAGASTALSGKAHAKRTRVV